MNIACIDFETANQSRVSMCAASIVVFEDGILTESRYWLVRPPKGHGFFREDYTDIHGLSWFDVQHAPEFGIIAPEFVEVLTRSEIVIAHSASFDMSVLRETLNHFGALCPAFDYLCTCHTAKRIRPELENHQLSTLGAHIGHEFNHHHAQSDAETAGQVLLAMMKHANANTPREMLEKAGLEPKRF